MGAMGDILGLSNPGYWVDKSNDGVSGNSNGDADPQWVGGPGGGAGGPGGAGGGSGNALGGLQNYFNSSGGQFLLNQGLGDINDKFASMGLSRSGAAMKAMEGYRHDLASTKMDNYLGHLSNMQQMALGAGGLITGAGQYSKGGTQGGAGPQLLGSAMSTLPFILSEPEAKTNIKLLRRDPDGLGWYSYAYKRDPETTVEGVMADEVERLRPHALGPRLANGWRTVNYAKLSEAA
jgi:hypothetical protein